MLLTRFRYSWLNFHIWPTDKIVFGQMANSRDGEKDVPAVTRTWPKGRDNLRRSWGYMVIITNDYRILLWKEYCEFPLSFSGVGRSGIDGRT